MAITTMKSNKGWRSRWFYLKNHDATPLPLFTSHTIVATPLVWAWGAVNKEKKRLTLLLGAIAYLNGHGLCGTNIIGAYHLRRVAPLMACALPLYRMALSMWLEGIALAQGLLHDSEIKQHIREALDELNAVFLVEGHLTMQPDTGFIDLVGTFQSPFHVSLLSGSYFLLHGLAFVGIVQPLL
jgi:hypothetical protein